MFFLRFAFFATFMIFFPGFADVRANKSDTLNKIGEYYHFGDQGVPRNFKKAHEYYLKAVELGSATAANHLAGLYANGHGVEKNLAVAEKWRLKSYELDPTLENKCANSPYPPNPLCALVISATSWNRGADSYYLGVFYENGLEGVDKDLDKAQVYYKRAANYGFELAIERLKRFSPSS